MDATASFLPMDRRQALARGAALPDRTAGAALFADISGFTPLTDMLVGTLGPRPGADALSAILNRVYAPLTDLVHQYGGSVAGYSGDALLAWFAGDEGERATTVALQMQAAMAGFAALPLPGGSTATLRLKCAVAAGPVRRFVVGDPAIQQWDVLAGGVLDWLLAAETLAAAGEVLLDPATAATLSDGLEIVEWRMPGAVAGPLGNAALQPEYAGLRYAVVGGITADMPPLAWPPAAGPPAAPAAPVSYQSWLLPAVRARLAHDGAFLAELRPALPLFLRWQGIDYEQRAAGEQLDAYIRWVQAVLARYDAAVLGLTVGDKGSYLHTAFGVPVAHGDDAARAAAAALELSRPPSQCPYVRAVQIGVSSGQVWAGAYGGPASRTYGVLGDAVNLAARLMEVAPAGGILATAEVRAGAGAGFRWADLAPRAVKGKAAAVAVAALVGEVVQRELGLLEPAYHNPLVGRETELRVLEARLAQAAAGHGQVVAIVGEAGIGKSRLVAEAIRRARAMGFAVYGGAAQAYGTTAAYLAWRPLWRAFFGLDGADPPATQAQTVAQAIQQLAPALAERLPLLGVVLGLDLPDTPLTAQFDARLRKSSLEALLVDCLRAQALASTPVLLVLEDCHWLDPLSQDLLEALSRAIPALPVLLLPASRPPDPGAPALLRRLAALAHYSDLPLGAIAAADAAALVQLHLGTLYPSIPAGVVDTLVARAAGNPFYLEELLAYLASRPRELQDPLSLAAMEWPASLQSVILARIDQLSESQRRTLKVASVIGRQFQAPQLWGAYPELGPVAVVQADLAVLDQVDLTPLDVPVPEPTYLFKHVLTQEVTYASIPHHLRTQLHAQLAAWLEAEDAGALDLLAYHYGRSSNPAKQREYYRKAAEAATAAYAHEVALGYYRQLVALVPLAEQPPLLLQMARITELVGQWAAAEALIQQALQIAEDAADVSQQAHCWHALGRLLGLKGSLDAAVAWLDKARTRFVALDDLPGLGPVLHTLGVLHVRQSQYAEAVACFERQVQIARQYQDRRLLARAWHGLANLYWQQGDWTLAEHYYQQTHAIYAELGDRLETSHALGNLGIIYKNQGQFARALACYAEDLRISTAIGAREGAGRTRGNIGNLYGQLGDFERAVGYSFQRLQITRDLGDPRGAMLAIGNIAEAYFWQGQHAAAGRLYPLAIALARALHIPHLLCALLTTSATVCLAGGYYRPAQAALAEALAVAGAIQRADILLEAHCLDIRARTALGQMAMIDAAATLAALAQAESEPARQAFVQYTHWQIDPTAAAARTAAATLYRRLHTERPEYPYAARYAELTGESLPALVLPDLPEYVLHPVPAPPDVVSYAEAVAHQVTPAGPERS